jgi:hypothetical protein
MKKSITFRILILITAILVLLTALASCSQDSAIDRDNTASSPSKGESFEAGGMDGEKPSDNLGGPLDGDYERKIIRTVKMTCETKAYDDATTVIMTALSAHGGYVEASSSTGTGYNDVKGSERRATYTFRVPAEKLDAFLEALRTDEGIRILSQNASSDEITATYYDTVSRLETLEAEKTSLTAMLEGFTDYSDISNMLKVQERLYNVIEEIEALKTKLNLYDGQVAMSTVHLTLNEVITYTEVVQPDPTFGERIAAAFKEGWADFGDGCQDFAVWLVEAFPTLLVLGVMAGGAATVLIILNRRANKRRESLRINTQQANPTPPYHPTDKNDR